MLTSQPTTSTPVWPDGASLREWEARARAVLDRGAWDFLAGGAGEEWTLDANLSAFRTLGLVPRVLRDVSAPDPRCELLGSRSSLPIAVAPMAYQRLFHPGGEVAVAAAAARAGVPYVVSMLSSSPFSDIAATGATTWLQLYWLRDRRRMQELLDQGEAVGVRGLVLTVDVPAIGVRLRDLANGFALASHVFAVNSDFGDRGRQPSTRESVIATSSASFLDASITWRDIEWIRSRTRLPIILKGIMDPTDAATAADLGVDALVVSNHGGRQLDRAAPSLLVLPEIVDEVAGRCEILLDSGVRSGTDVLVALASGATAVLVGRPLLWGLSVAGQEGCSRVLDILKTELTSGMRIAGCPDLAAVSELRTVSFRPEVRT
ncbi:alpha-hydroxy acid oxidase [Micromonospora parva]|uniref:alpha-hydroxy acid oxidase n=1 Tax=Micromonospora parva TaxID=1464048 RepID=UPI003F4CF356